MCGKVSYEEYTMVIENTKIWESAKKYQRYAKMMRYVQFLREIDTNPAVRELLLQSDESITIASWGIGSELTEKVCITMDGNGLHSQGFEKNVRNHIEMGKLLFQNKINQEKMKKDFWDNIQCIIDDEPEV